MLAKTESQISVVLNMSNNYHKYGLSRRVQQAFLMYIALKHSKIISVSLPNDACVCTYT